MGCSCNKPKCNGQCGCNSPAVAQINNPAEYISFHKVDIPAQMGDDTTNPPTIGKYRNVILHYEANGQAYIYSSDGIPTKLTTSQSGPAPVVEEKPYSSLRRLGSYTYEITFDKMPEYKSSSILAGACSSLVKGGKLYRNFDWHYDEAPTFVVKCKGFTGIANGDKLVDGKLNDELLAQLPYRIVDGFNDNGIMMSTHVLYNDWRWDGCGSKSNPLQMLPYLVLSRVKSMATIADDLASVISNLSGLKSEYLLQLVITDGTTTYALMPPENTSGNYVLADISANPKLTNFRWVSNKTVERGAAYMQNRPTGVERWNEMSEDMKELRFTKAYESNARLSEFIGINDTTKASPDSSLQTIYAAAHNKYLNKTRNGELWQTVHSVVYSKHGMEHLYTQENWDVDYIADVDKEAADSSFISGIGINLKRSDNTDCYIATIPVNDTSGEMIKPYVARHDGVSPLRYADAENTTLTVNAGLTAYDSQGKWRQATVIGNGVVIQHSGRDLPPHDYNRYLCIKKDRTVFDMEAVGTTEEMLLASGAENAYMVFYRFMNNGQLEPHTDAGNWNVASPRMDIGVKDDNTIVILATDGRTGVDAGLNDEQAFAVLKAEGCTRAWRCDGGGSTSMVYKGSKLNRNIDDNNTTDRGIYITLNLKSEEINKEVADVYSYIGETRQLLNKQIRLDLEDKISKVNKDRAILYADVENATLNNIVEASTYQSAKLNGRYRHGNSIMPHRTEDNYVDGITISEIGMVRMLFEVNINSKASGEKRFRIIRGDTGANLVYRGISVSESGDSWKQVVLETVFNNKSNTPVDLLLEVNSDNAGDRMLRMSLFAETLGWAESQ